jgi:hypothetical protein
MRTIPVVSSALLVVGLAAGANAQATQTESQPTTTVSTPPEPNQQYGLNLARIQRGLQRSAERQDYDGLNLRFYVNVYAPAPKIKLFTPLDNLLYGPAPYGAPTHRDMMNLMTPQEFSAPAADFSGVARWLANKAKK